MNNVDMLFRAATVISLWFISEKFYALYKTQQLVAGLFISFILDLFKIYYLITLLLVSMQTLVNNVHNM